MAAPTIVSPRHLGNAYNWHPAVHKRFGEHLHFYLIRLRDPLHEPVSEQIRRALQDAHVEYACEYSIFGFWDALVRVWLTPAAEKKFERIRKDPAANMADVRHFQARHMHHFWLGHDRDLLADDRDTQQAIAARDDDIRFTVNHPDHEDVEMWERLFRANVLLERRNTLSDCPDDTGEDSLYMDGAAAVKFYVALSRPDEELPVDRELRRVFEAIESSGLQPRSSLYAGDGEFGSYLVRCVADTYSDVLKWSASLDVSLRATNLRPMTLLIANTDAREWDNVNDLYALTGDDSATFDLLELEEGDEALLAELSGDQREALNRLVTTVHAISVDQPSIAARLRPLLRSSLKADKETLMASLAFFLEFEGFLETYLKRVWGEVYKDWPTELAADFEQADIQPLSPGDMKPDKWTLGGMYHAALNSAKANNHLAHRFHLQLGDDWETKMGVLAELRNLIAHAGLRQYSSFMDFTGPWGQRLAQIINAAPLYFTIERFAQ
jgi:hypothetical protein